MGLKKERAELWVALVGGAGPSIKDTAGKNDARLEGKGGAWER
jgi:hypothetical protein